MHNMIILILVLVSATSVFANDFIYSSPHHNRYMYNRQNYNRSGNNYSNNRMKSLERYALNRTYSYENEISRLERLENLAFGSIQDGDMATRFKNVENAILAKGHSGYKRNVLSTIGSYFTGQMTGLTPNIIPYSNSFYPNYNNTYSNQYSNGIFSRGYTNYGNTYGSGSGIRILD